MSKNDLSDLEIWIVQNGTVVRQFSVRNTEKKFFEIIVKHLKKHIK